VAFRKQRWQLWGRWGRLGLLVSMTAMFLVLVDGPTPASASDQITLTLTRPDGAALANARVAVYLEPFEPPEEYVPERLASGRADGAGRFSFPIPASIQSTVGEPEINALVRAMDPQRRWLVDWTLVLPTSGGALETVPATVRVSDAFPSAPPSEEDWVGTPVVREVEADDPDGGDPSEDEVVVERPDSDACMPTPDAVCATDHQVATKRRWVKVTQHHLSKGMRGSFSYLNGRETQTQVATKVGNANWGVGGWVTELKNRSDSHTATKEGPFHRVWLARYRYAKYHWVVYCQENWLYGVCATGYTWKPKNWTGGIARSDWFATQPDRDSKYSVKLVGTYTRNSGENVTFGVGVQLVGLELKSQSGYSTITKLTWEKIPGCSKARWLYGNGADPAEAKVIFASCG
jgi:hypothetical protein